MEHDVDEAIGYHHQKNEQEDHPLEDPEESEL